MAAVASRRTFPVADGIVGLDLMFQGRPGGIGAFALVGPGGRFVLIESGPESTYEGLLAALSEAGLEPSRLEAVLLTHIHLDHAGAAGRLARQTGCAVYVHPVGLPHLADPSRLWASASRVFGDAMERLWKAITPVPQDRLRPLEDGVRLTLVGRDVEAYHTPGHASHHVVFRVDGSLLFAGDLAGVRLPQLPYVRVPAMPPELEVETWIASLRRARELRPRQLVLTHFGSVTEGVEEHLAAVERQLRRWSEAVLDGMRDGLDDAGLLRRLQALEAREMGGGPAADEARATLELVTPLGQVLQGYRRYWTRHHPERLTTSSPRP